jgi:hypothetical protein
MGVESYLHKYAKIVVCSWLRTKIRIGEKFKGLDNIKLSLKLPKQSPMYSVYSEYPVCKSLIKPENNNVNNIDNIENIDNNISTIIGLDVMWDVWLTNNNLNDKVKSKTRIPTIYELKDIADKLEIITVFDIGIVDESKLKYVFEIEHTHASTARKIKFIEDNNLIGYELSAQKVMEQVKLPFNIPINKEWNT